MMHALLITEQLCSYAARDWVLVTYAGNSHSYRTEITEAHKKNLQIKVMQETAGNIKLLKGEYNIYYSEGNVVKSLSLPPPLLYCGWKEETA